MILKSKTKNLINQKFDKWEVVEFYGYVNRNAFWLCKCKCGLVKPVKAQYLLSHTSKGCSACGNPRANIKDIPPKIWNYIVKRAARKNYKFEVSKEFAYELFLKQNRKCALTGVELYIPVNASEYLERKGTASLDRIDSSKGYLPNNIQWIHKDVNRMKNIFPQDYFIQICNLIAKNHPANSSSVGELVVPLLLP